MTDQAGHHTQNHTSGTAQDQLSVLDATSHLLTASNFDLDMLLEEIVRLTVEKLRVKACAIRLLNEETEEMVLRAVNGLSSEYLDKGPVIAGKSAFREVIDSGEVTEIFDITQETIMQYPKEALAEGIRSLLVVGLMQDRRAIGALSVYTYHPHHFSVDEVRAFQTIANQATGAIHLAKLHREQMRMKQIEQELAIAAHIQARMMPSRPPGIEGIDIAARNIPCGEVGGDFYDFLELPKERLGLMLGDVSGKGIPAALLMATARTVLRVQGQSLSRPAEVVERANLMLCEETTQSEFVTVFYALLDIQEGNLTYVNAGHNYPLLFRGNQVIPLESGGVPLGLFCDSSYREEVIPVQPGDLLVIYSDGYVELVDDSGQQFGVERFQQVISTHRRLKAEEIVNRLEETMVRFENSTGRGGDDRTVVVLKI